MSKLNTFIEEHTTANYYHDALDKDFPAHLDLSARDVFGIVGLGKDAFPNSGNTGHCTNEDSDFRGCTFEEFKAMGEGEFNIKPFLKARDKMRSLSETLQKELAPVGRARKRRMSEHDGEWSLDRQWELHPFASTYQVQTGVIPFLRILVDCSFNAGHKAADIAEYGAFCWSVVDAIEKQGIATEVVLQNTSAMLINEGSETYHKAYGSNKLRVSIKVKETGQYMDTLAMARCFTAGFYRRGVLGVKYSTGERLGSAVEVSGALSYPEVDNQPTVSQGQVFLRREHAQSSPLTIAEYVKQALQVQGVASA